MAQRKVDALVVGGGQAGIAMSEHLGKAGLSHLVLEKKRIAERWRSERWDSLVANGPAWHDRFPGLAFEGANPDAFVPKEEVADYFEAYAKMIDAPVRTGVEVTKVTRIPGETGFRAETSDGVIEAETVIAATGAFQTPVFPKIIPETAALTQMHSTAYRNPDQLAKGAVLVVGAGSSGVQIAEELMDAGRQVYLSVGSHNRPPRSYRGRDFCWWLGILNKWDAEFTPGSEHVTIAVSGAKGGHTIDFRKLAHRGMTLVGMTKTCESGKLAFSDDLVANIKAGDENYLALLEEADAYVTRYGLDLPEEAEAKIIDADPDCLTNPVLELDLQQAGITTVIWATGFVRDYGWLQVDAFDDNGVPKHQRGVSVESGIYFLGLPWQTRRGSSFIWGVWYDAKYISDHIAKQRAYQHYLPAAESFSKNRSPQMAHTRIRKFNTKETYPEQNLDNDLCQAVVARGTMVFVRGQIGQNLDTSENVGVGDVKAQTEQAMFNIKMLLEEAGSELDHITKITIYIIDPRYREDVYRIVGKWLKGVFPVSTGIVVSALARPEWLVEIDATAIIPDT